MRLLIVILNYRTAGLAVDCIRSLADEVRSLGQARVVVADNLSPDDSLPRLAQAIEDNGWGDFVSLMPLERNGGFAFGNNAAVRAALASDDKPDYVLLLNPDTIVRPKALLSLVGFMDQRPEVAICGCSLEDAEGTLQHTAHRFPSPLGELDRGARLGALRRLMKKHADVPPDSPDATAVDWVSGASLLVRRQLFETIGLMDEGYFLYYEEVDFCARAASAGFRIFYLPSVRIVHLEGQSTGIIHTKKRRAPYWYDSRRRFFVKRYGVLGLMVSDMLWAMGRATFVVRRALRLGCGGPDGDPAHFAFDLIWGDLRALLTGKLFRIRREARIA